MTSILVGIDGSERSEHALEWAVRHAARTGASLALLTVIDPDAAHAAGINDKVVSNAVNSTMYALQANLAAKYPDIEVTSLAMNGKVVDCLVDEAAKHDMVVLGSHHGSSIADAVGAARGLRVSVSSTVPTVLVPADWTPEVEGKGIVVGVAPDGSSENAVALGVRAALARKQPLRLVSAWGLPPILTRPAEIMGGGLAPVGEQFQAALDTRVQALKEEFPELEVTGVAVEGSSPMHVLLDEGKDSKMLVLGTHSRKALGRALFGSVSHGVTQKLNTPTIIVPQG